MTRYFTTYWTAAPWERNAFGPVEHAASNGFAARGLEPGDHLYIVNYRDREVFLGARLTVERVVTKREAAQELGVGAEEIWDARDHVLAAPDSVQRLHPNRVIPGDLLRGLTLLTNDGNESGLRFDGDGAANQQTLRSVRELSASSALALDALIDWDVAPRASEILSMLLSRGPCFGDCPVYTLTFLADGVAAWHGDSFVDRLGSYRGEFGREAFADLASFSASNGFFRLEEEYLPIFDLPGYKIVIGTGARDKAVRAWGTLEPRPFADLADRLDGIAESIEWQRSKVDAPI